MRNLYDVARQTCHEMGLPWTDPRTGVTHEPPTPCRHPNVTRLPGVTSTGVKISICNDCHEQIEEDLS